MVDQAKKNSEVTLKQEIEHILRFLTSEEQTELLPYIEKREWQSGELVMKDGDQADFMGFLVKGKLAVKKETSFAGKYILVAILDKGALVGEASVFDTGRRTATVEAMEHSILLTLSRSNMDKLFQVKKELAVKILKRILHVLSMRLQNADDRLAWLL